MQDIRSPSCFYHPNQLITNFCLHSKCILPLCKKCLEIHRENNQNLTGEHASKMIGYQQAKNIAVQSIGAQIDKIQKARTQFNEKYRCFRSQMLQNMNNNLNNIQEQIFLNWGIAQKEQKFVNNRQKIMSGSIKQIINHYQNGNFFKSDFFHESFTWHINDHQLKNFILEACIHKHQNLQQNTVEQTLISQSQTQQYRNSEIQVFCQKQFPTNSLQILNQSKMKTLQCGNLADELSSKKSLGSRKTIFGDRSSNKKKRTGIFVASSPKFEEKTIKKQFQISYDNNKALKVKKSCKKAKYRSNKMTQRSQQQNISQQTCDKRASQREFERKHVRRCSSEMKITNQNMSFMDPLSFSKKNINKNQSRNLNKQTSLSNFNYQNSANRLRTVAVPITIVPHDSSKTLKSASALHQISNKLRLQNHDSWKKVVKIQNQNKTNGKTMLSDACNIGIKIEQFNATQPKTSVNTNKDNQIQQKPLTQCCQNKFQGMMNEIMTPQQIREMIVKKRNKNKQTNK